MVLIKIHGNMCFQTKCNPIGDLSTQEDYFLSWMISLSFYEKELKIFHYLNITGTIKHSYNNKTSKN